MKISINTVAKYCCGSPEKFLEGLKPAFVKAHPFQEEIISLLNNKAKRKDIYSSIAKNGYTGCMAQLHNYCMHLVEMGMVQAPSSSRNGELADGQTRIKYHYVSRHRIFRYIWNGEGEIGRDDLEFIKNTFPVIGMLSECLSQFRNVFAKKSAEALLEYIARYKGSELELLKKLAESLEKDIVPVTNAVVEKYSNGYVEGTNNKLKLIKRIGYGRCKLPLLRSKIVLGDFF